MGVSMARSPPQSFAAGACWAYWRSDLRTLRQGFVALFISSGGDLLAGLALSFMGPSLPSSPACPS